MCHILAQTGAVPNPLILAQSRKGIYRTLKLARQPRKIIQLPKKGGKAIANQEHLEILKQGVEVWNHWRREHPDVRPDLREVDFEGTKLFDAHLRVNIGESRFFFDVPSVDLKKANLVQADLSKSDLRKVDFSWANLSQANLSQADLRKARLIRTELVGANLSKTILSGTELSGANLTSANLSGAELISAGLSGANLSKSDLRRVNLTQAALQRADLSGSDLSGANLSGAQLYWADLTEAKVGFTVFGNVDLKQVKGLDTVEHSWPSTIGIDTIYRSGGHIPESFLKGAGASDSFLEYIRSLVGKPVEYYSCFISYSSKDEAFAQRLYADLQNNNVRCWFAPEDMKIGERIRSLIDESIRIYDKLLLILSEHSVTSKWVQFEVEAAMDKEQEEKLPVLFPVRLDRAVMDSTTAWAAHIKRTRHIGDFTNWENHDDYQKAFERLLRDLKASS